MKTKVIRRPAFLSSLLLSSLLFGTVGCESLLHELQSHRLHRWNRHTPLSSSGSDAYSFNETPGQNKIQSDWHAAAKIDANAHQAGFTTTIVRAQND